MGLFDILKKNKTENKKVTIYAPVNGKVIDLSEVPDEAFSQRMIGDGCAIEPSQGSICSPINGELANVFPTKHAIIFENKEGLELIVHFGVDTVKLNGEGFEKVREEGSTKVGDEIVKYDLELISSKAPSVKTPVLINNMDLVEKIEILALAKDVKIGDAIMEVTLK